MKRTTQLLIVLGLLLVLSIQGDAHQAGGIDFQLAPGTYDAFGQFTCTVVVDAAGNVTLASVGSLVPNTKVTIGKPHPGDPPPPPADFAKAVRDSLAKVADDKKTAETLVKVYETYITGIDEGKLDDAGNLVTAITLTNTSTARLKPDWTSFAEVVNAAAPGATTIPQVKSLLAVVVTELKRI